MVKRHIILIAISAALTATRAAAQEHVSLATCIELATRHNQLSSTDSLYARIQRTNNDLARLAKKPRLSVEAEASIQSEALKLEIPIPMHPVSRELPLYRAKAYGQLLYPILDGDLPAARAEVQNREADIRYRQDRVKLYDIKSRITELVFGLHLLDAKRKLLESTRDILERKLYQVQKARQGGVATALDVHRIEAKILELNNQIASIQTEKAGTVALINTLTGAHFSTQTVFDTNLPDGAERPEYALFDATQKKLEATKKVAQAEKKVKLSAFVQAGAGVPNPLNFFDDGISPYAIGGLKLSWPITDWGRSDKIAAQVDIQKQIVEAQKQAFTLQLHAAERRINSQINKIKKELEGDRAALALQQQIVKDVNSRFRNGVATSLDYLTEVNKETRIRLRIATKETQIQFLKAQRAIQEGI